MAAPAHVIAAAARGAGTSRPASSSLKRGVARSRASRARAAARDRAMARRRAAEVVVFAVADFRAAGLATDALRVAVRVTLAFVALRTVCCLAAGLAAREAAASTGRAERQHRAAANTPPSHRRCRMLSVIIGWG